MWTVALLAGLLVSWPLLYGALRHGPSVIVGCLTGDSYHYLAIARKAMQHGIYTYDGITVTNGFHPLWQWTLRAVWTAFDLRTHESQAIAAMSLACAAGTVGVILASASIVRFTGSRMLGLLVVPGVYYLAAGAHVRNLWIWNAFDGMESCCSVLFGGLLLFVVSGRMAPCAARPTLLGICRAAGLVLPFVVLSRLDDVFMVAGLGLGVALVDAPLRDRIRAAAWLGGPTAATIAVYLVYNHVTAGSAMPLSGGTKAGFVAHTNAYLSSAVHVPPVLDLKALVTGEPVAGPQIFNSSFRFVEMLYPAAFGLAGCAVVLRHFRGRHEAALLFGLCAYLVIKGGYNFVNVNPWHQSAWYYLLSILCVSFVSAIALARAWAALSGFAVVRWCVAVAYVAVALLDGSQFYAGFAYFGAGKPDHRYWLRRAEIRKAVTAAGIRGIVNMDDGITAFLLDLPNVHGFGYATDLGAQAAVRSGSLLTLAYDRGINGLAGHLYLRTAKAPVTDAEIKAYLMASLAGPAIRADIDKFEFRLAYYDPVLELPFVTFNPKDTR